ncbi:flagellar biosynthesis protein FlhF [Cohnella cellulosilytica]|uniref:Flagellar biosynthesis protein FlhF n=1 Tax=Cohnella cellulosilytica TaxID=986710 RepID=A0ABW2FJX5_9BACL
MKVKRYIVDDVPEAVQMIRAELGSDAVILNTKEIRVGGFLGMFRQKRMEVIAAVDETARKAPPRTAALAGLLEKAPAARAKEAPSATPGSGSAAAPIPSNAVRERYTKPPFSDSGRQPADSPLPAAAKEAPAPADPLPRIEQRPPADPLPRVEPPEAAERQRPTGDDPLDRLRTGIADRLRSDALAAVEPQTETSRESELRDETSVVLQELRSLREMMARMTRTPTAQPPSRAIPESVLKWSKRLAEQGMEPAYVEQFAEAAAASLRDGAESGRSAYEAARGVLLGWLNEARGDGVAPETRIVHFVGPTGVGKTTTIAKLAADQAFSRRRSVGFITADTYRIAAVDQLRTYADILNVPLEVVFSPGELTRAYHKLGDRDLLFMDTAGRNYRNELYVSEVNSLLSPVEGAETILVLSLTSKYADMKAVAAQFAKYGVRQLLLTKFDETESYGSVVNLVKEFDFRISYYTCGQTVPDDIRPFDPDELVRKLLGDPGDD